MGGIVVIRLHKSACPKQLTKDVQKTLTDEFIASEYKKAVWNKIYIKSSLLSESHKKCAYCECLIGPGHREMHVDHYYPKKKYPLRVVEWNNLIPSCPHCNKSKNDVDPTEFPIINPYEDDPKDYFYFKGYRLKCKKGRYYKKAKNTLNVFDLNDPDETGMLLYKCGNGILEKIEVIFEDIQTYANTKDSNLCFRILRAIKNILKQGVKDSEYGAYMATIIHSSDEYNNIRDMLIGLNLWSENLESLHQESISIKFDITE